MFKEKVQCRSNLGEYSKENVAMMEIYGKVEERRGKTSSSIQAVKTNTALTSKRSLKEL